MLCVILYLLALLFRFDLSVSVVFVVCHDYFLHKSVSYNVLFGEFMYRDVVNILQNLNRYRKSALCSPRQVCLCKVARYNYF